MNHNSEGVNAHTGYCVQESHTKFLYIDLLAVYRGINNKSTCGNIPFGHYNHCNFNYFII